MNYNMHWTFVERTYKRNHNLQVMVQLKIQLSKETNKILDNVKAKYGLANRSEALEKVIRYYGQNILEPHLRPKLSMSIKRGLEDVAKGRVRER
jgi:hypothetical protein